MSSRPLAGYRIVGSPEATVSRSNLIMIDVQFLRMSRSRLDVSSGYYCVVHRWVNVSSSWILDLNREGHK